MIEFKSLIQFGSFWFRFGMQKIKEVSRDKRYEQHKVAN